MVKKRKLSQASQQVASQATQSYKKTSKKKLMSLADKIGVELKYKDTLNNSYTITDDFQTAYVACLNFIAQGDTSSSRDGKKIIISSIQVRGHITASPLTDQADMLIPPIIRILLVVDKQCNGTVLDPREVEYESTGTAVDALRYPEYASRYQVLWDKTIAMKCAAFNDAAATGTITLMPEPFECFKTCNIPVNYFGADADQEAIVDNAIYLLAVTNSTSYTPKLYHHSRVRFVG